MRFWLKRGLIYGGKMGDTVRTETKNARHFSNYRTLTNEYVCLEIQPGDRPACLNLEICLKNKKLFLSKHCYEPDAYIPIR